MKKLVLTICICFYFIIAANSQTAVMVDPKNTSIESAQKMIGISKITEAIKLNIGTLKKVEIQKDILGYKEAYFKTNSLQLIKVLVKDNGIEKLIEWYYAEGKLIYSEANWTDITTKKAVNKVQCYFDKDHLITWIDFGNKFLDPNSLEFKERDSQMDVYGKKLYDEAMKK
jgi:hypothetical protein